MTDERPTLNRFQTCPAATGTQPGYLTPNDGPQCRIYPDGAHRCHQQRVPHIIHQCLCQLTWYNTTPRSPQ